MNDAAPRRAAPRTHAGYVDAVLAQGRTEALEVADVNYRRLTNLLGLMELGDR